MISVNGAVKNPCASPRCGHLFCRSFDFDGDERWRQYEANIEIPPGRDRDSVLKKFKAKWYKREIVSSGPALTESPPDHMTCQTLPKCSLANTSATAAL